MEFIKWPVLFSLFTALGGGVAWSAPAIPPFVSAEHRFQQARSPQETELQTLSGLYVFEKCVDANGYDIEVFFFLLASDFSWGRSYVGLVVNPNLRIGEALTHYPQRVNHAGLLKFLTESIDVNVRTPWSSERYARETGIVPVNEFRNLIPIQIPQAPVFAGGSYDIFVDKDTFSLRLEKQKTILKVHYPSSENKKIIYCIDPQFQGVVL